MKRGTAPKRFSVRWEVALLVLAVVLTAINLLAAGTYFSPTSALFTDMEENGANTFESAEMFISTMTAHSETTSLGGTAYYDLKREAPADGTATTITAIVPATTTGRFRPSSNEGRFVFPLSGLQQIPASTNTDGFIWFVDAYDISLGVTGSWEDIDLSYYVPVGATGAIVEVVNSSIVDSTGVVRGKEDTRDYMSDAAYEEIEAETHRWQIVKVDSERCIQGHIGSVDVDFKLRGYTAGSDPVYYTTPPDVTPGVTQAWTEVDVSGHVDADADGVILFIDSIRSGDRAYGIREVGSSYATVDLELEEYGNTMYLVGIDASDRFEAYIQSVDVKIYLVGQTKGSVVYYVDDVAISDPVLGLYEEIDADDYGIPGGANGLIFLVEMPAGSGDRKINFRQGDSGDDWNGDVGGGTHYQGATGLRLDNVWDQYQEHATTDVFIAAYTKGVEHDGSWSIAPSTWTVNYRARRDTGASNSGSSGLWTRMT